MESKKIIVIGGGAAGFFAAINCKLMHPNYEVTILEKTTKLLSKVLVSGGGRCNVTHNCMDNTQLVKNYPRGEKELLQVFSRFSVKDTIEWFKNQDIELKVENDNRMFPSTNKSETIANCFLNLSHQLKINIVTQCEVFKIIPGKHFEVKTSTGVLNCDAVICSAGGHHKIGAYQFISNLGHRIIEPIPSLFTINLPNESLKEELQGVSVKQAKVSIKDTKYTYLGPLLITHWGISGPAVLKLSAFAAAHFFASNYTNTILINWAGELKLNEIIEVLNHQKKNALKSYVINTPLFDLPKRIWEFIIHKTQLNSTLNWSNISNNQLNKLAEQIYSDAYKMEGKTTFKEEFVTAGGVDLKEVNFKTMESKLVNGLFFCGEVLNIDGITGGFNFQAAWSTAYTCALSV